MPENAADLNQSGCTGQQKARYAATQDALIDKNSFIQLKSSDTFEHVENIRVFYDSIDERVLKIAEKFRNDPSAKNERVLISEAGERETAELGTLIGIDVFGFPHAADKAFFRHVEERHGENGARDESMKSLRDVARADWILNNYDTVVLVAPVSLANSKKQGDYIAGVVVKRLPDK